MAALDGTLAGKSHRRIAADLYGEAEVAAAWHDGAAVRGRVRRRIRDALDLMNGGYHALVTGGHPPPRHLPAMGGMSRADIGERESSSLPSARVDRFNEPGHVAGRPAMYPPRYLDTRHAADYLGISPSTLNRMRVTGEGPRYAKAGRRVIYDPEDLNAWVEERKRRFTGEGEGS